MGRRPPCRLRRRWRGLIAPSSWGVVAGVTILLLAAVDSTGMWGMQAGVTLAADHLVALLLLGGLAERGVDDAAPQMKHQVQDGLFLGIIV